MNKKILMLNEKKGSFMLKAAQKALAENGFEVDEILPNIDEINREKENARLIIVYIGEYLTDDLEVLFYLKDICIEQEIKLCLIGYKEQAAEVKNKLPETIVYSVIERPIDVKILVDNVNGAMELLSADEMKKHILIVDDSGMTLRTVKSWLTPKYKVSMANSAASAITFLANNKPDLIILDYEMPVCPGPQLMEMIQAETSTADIPIMFLTSKNDAESVKYVLSLKPAGYMLKTMPPEEVIQIVDEFFITHVKY